MVPRQEKSPVGQSRSGVAVSELAVCLPVVVLVVFGTIEICSMIFLTQSLRVCAYEGARVALVPGAQAGNVEGSCQAFLTSRGIKSTTLSIVPRDFHRRPYGTTVTVSVTADCAANSLLPPWFYAGRTVNGTVRMMVER